MTYAYTGACQRNPCGMAGNGAKSMAGNSRTERRRLGHRTVSSSDIDLLFEACGAIRPYKLGLEYPPKKLKKPRDLAFPFAVIGRSSKNDIVLSHTQISRRHAYLQVIQGRPFWYDLKSRAGIHRDGGPDGSGWSEPAQAVRIGPFVLRPDDTGRREDGLSSETGALPDPLASCTPEVDFLPAVTLHFLTGLTTNQPTWRVNRVLTLVGSSPLCKLQLVDPRVSRFHGSILRTTQGVWIIDLLGRGGIGVNGKKMRFARLCNGDELQFGMLRIRVECSASDCLATRPGQDRSNAAHCDLIIGSQSPTREIETIPSGNGPDVLPALVGRANSSNTSIVAANRLPAEAYHGSQESFISSLLVQFGQMQQQMSVQFQQAVMTIVEMFRSVHQDHMELIRDELIRLRELNQDLLAIQTELSKLQRDQNPARSAVQQETAVSHVAGLSQFDLAQSDAAASPADSRPNERARETKPQGAFQSESAVEARRRERERLMQVPEGEDIHAWLCHRMAAIQNEQQTLWQRILTTIRAKASL